MEAVHTMLELIFHLGCSTLVHLHSSGSLGGTYLMVAGPGDSSVELQLAELSTNVATAFSTHSSLS